jgi:8-oxo-dGTP diphosphatase
MDQPLGYNLRYTLCFIRHQPTDQILMLLRRYPPNEGYLNGVGGKIEPDEVPWEANIREVAEETGIPLDEARFGGIVTWPLTPGVKCRGGMFVYTADLPHGMTPWTGITQTTEGDLRWFSTDSACRGSGVVDNIPYFLPRLLGNFEPVEFFCEYNRGVLQRVETSPLADEFRRLGEKPKAPPLPKGLLPNGGRTA